MIFTPAINRFLFCTFACLCVVAIGGCKQTWNGRFTQYTPASSEYDSSINGNTVFYDLCRSHNARCRRARAVSPMMKKYDCIIWFCSDNHLPDDDAVQWFENWLKEKPGRTLVFVGRSYEADVLYWEKVVPLAPEEGNQKGRAKLALADARRRLARVFGPPERPDQLDSFTFQGDDSWFDLKKFDSPLTVTQFEGEERFFSDVDTENMELVLYGGLIPQRDENTRILLSGRGYYALDREKSYLSEEETLIAERRIGESRLIMIPNGSFLLNYPMVNEENRKIAAALLDEISPKGKNVVFLRMGYELQESAGHTPPSIVGLQLLQMWPVSLIFWHMIFIGVLVCFWKWPVFGRARVLQSRQLSDFMMHIDAYAALLERPANVAYAREQLAKFRDKKSEREA